MTNHILAALVVISFVIAVPAIAHEADSNLGNLYTQKAVNEREQSAYKQGFTHGMTRAQIQFYKQLQKLCGTPGAALEVFDGFLLICAPKEALSGGNNNNQ